MQKWDAKPFAKSRCVSLQPSNLIDSRVSCPCSHRQAGIVPIPMRTGMKLRSCTGRGTRTYGRSLQSPTASLLYRRKSLLITFLWLCQAQPATLWETSLIKLPTTPVWLNRRIFGIISSLPTCVDGPQSEMRCHLSVIFVMILLEGLWRICTSEGASTVVCLIAFSMLFASDGAPKTWCFRLLTR